MELTVQYNKHMKKILCRCGCGSEFDTSTPPWSYPSYQKKHCRFFSGHNYRGVKRRPFTKQHKRRISEATRLAMGNPEVREKISGPKRYDVWSKGLTKYDHPSLMSTSRKLTGRSPSQHTRRKIAKTLMRNHSPEELSRNGFKGLLACTLRPNRTEKEMGSILKVLCPGLFVYAGNGAHRIGSLAPDFICKKYKLVVEVAGTQWHHKGYTTKRTKQLRKSGYRCLVFWDTGNMRTTQVKLEVVSKRLIENEIPVKGVR